MLSVQIGESLEVGITQGQPGTRTVVGLLSEPLDRQSTTALVVDPILLNQPPVYWVTDTDPATIPVLGEQLNLRLVSSRTVSSIVFERQDQLPSSIRALPDVALLLAVILSMLAVAGVAGLRSLFEEDRSALVSAGWTPRRSWRLISWSTAGVMLLGSLLGVLIAFIVARALIGFISTTFGMDWRSPAWSPRGELLLALIVPLVIVTLARPLRHGYGWLRHRSRQQPAHLTPRRPKLLVHVAGTLAAVGAISGTGLASKAELISYVHPAVIAGVFGLLIFCCLRAVGELMTYRLGPALASLLRHIQSPMLWVSGALVGVAVLASFFAALTGYNARVLAAQASEVAQPVGSLVLTGVPAAASDRVATAYQAAGGRDILILDIARDFPRETRVTSPSSSKCLLEHRSDVEAQAQCLPLEPQVPLNIVGLSSDGSLVGRADPSLIEDGRVGLVFFEAGATDISGVQPWAAVPDTRFGGALPGLVLDSAPAKDELRIVSSGEVLVWLRDFAVLGSSDKARMRSTLGRIAPNAQAIELGKAGGQELEIRLANRAAYGGTILVVVMGAIAIGTVSSGQSSTRRLLLDIGMGMRRSRELIIKPLMPGVVTALVLLAVMPAGVWASALKGPGGLGVVWMGPLLAVIAVSLITPWAAARLNP